MKHFILILVLMLTSFQVSAQDSSRPQVSEKPYNMMRKLSLLEGRWNMVTEMTEDGGATWQSFPQASVTISSRHKGMILAEVPLDVSLPGFHMETYITYDQYRNVYRKVAVDDVWGIMDIYDGDLKDNVVVFTNVRSGTTFPVSKGVWRHFRLTLELKNPVRKLHIEKSDDNGKSWQQTFRITYTLIPASIKN